MHRVHIDTSLVPLRRKDKAEKKWEDCIGMQLPILKDNIPTGEYVTIEDYILDEEKKVILSYKGHKYSVVRGQVKRHVPLAISVPEMIKCFPEDVIWEEGVQSNKRVECNCINCGEFIGEREIRTHLKGLCLCLNCKDGFSLGAKFAWGILKDFSNRYNFKLYTEKYFDWCEFDLSDGSHRRGRYDFYFSYLNNNYIVEIDGGFHSQDNSMSGQTKELSMEIDENKTRLAIENDIKIIRINSVTNSIQVLKERIVSSELGAIFNFNDINWDDIYQYLKTPLIVKVAEQWNKGLPNKEIAIELDISKQTVHHYLEKADTLGLLMNYSRQEVEKRKGVLRSEYLINSQPHVTRINDMKEWISSSSCAEELGVDQSTITKACKEHTTVNIFYNGEPAYFMYTEEYIEKGNIIDLHLLHLEGWIGNHVSKSRERCVCLNDRKKFISRKDAAEYYNISIAAIVDNTLHRTDCAYDKYIFVNYTEYVSLSEEEIKNRLKLIPDRRIILLNTGEIFEAPYIACKQLNIENSHLSQTLNHICDYCGEDKIYHDGLVFKRMTEYDPKEKVQLFLRSKGIIAIDINKVFYSKVQALLYLNKPSKNNNFLHYNYDKVNGKEYCGHIWMYLSDYFDLHPEIHNQIEFYREHVWLEDSKHYTEA